MDRQTFLKGITLLTEIFPALKMTDLRMEIIFDATKHLLNDQYLKAINEIIVKEELSFDKNIIPMILRHSGSTIEVETEAQIIVCRIILALKKYGWSSAREAKAYVGDIGWQAIESFGGWVQFCETYGEETAGQYRAQLRDSIQALIRRAKEGKGFEPLQLIDIQKRELPANVKLLTAKIGRKIDESK